MTACRAFASGSWPRGCARCPRRSRRCSSAPRCRPPSATCASAASSPRCSARSSSRSAPTSPTTTPTRAAAPTPRTASGPVRVTAGGLVPPRQVLVATYVSFGLAVLCGVYLVWLAGPILLAIGAASILAGVLYTGGPRPYGYEGLGEVFVFLFFGIVAVTGSYYVQAEQVTWEAFVLAVPVGLLASAILVVNNVRDLESDRRAGKRTLAVRLGRERARTLYGLMVYGAFLTAPVPWVAGSLSAWLLLPLVLLPRGRLARARRAPPRRRADPQPGAGAHRDAAARVLRAAVGGAAAELMDVRVATVTLTFADPMRTAFGVLRKRELLLLRLRDADGVVGWGEAAPLEPYDGVSPAKVRDAFEAYEAILRDGDGNPAADLLERCRIVADVPQALAAVDLALWDLAGNREGKPVSELISDDPDTEVRVNATIPAEDRTHAAEQAAAAAQRGLLVRQGQGRHRRRRRPGGRRARRGRLARWSCAWTPTAPGRSTRPSRRSTRSRRRASSSSRSPCTACSAMRQVRDRVAGARGDGRDRRPAGLADRQGGRRGVPEGLALRRDLAAAGPGRARARVRRRRLPRLDLRRAAGHRRRRPLRRRAEDDRGLRAGDARAVRRRADRAARSSTARSPSPRSPGSASRHPARAPRCCARLGADRARQAREGERDREPDQRATRRPRTGSGRRGTTVPSMFL